MDAKEKNEQKESAWKKIIGKKKSCCSFEIEEIPAEERAESGADEESDGGGCGCSGCCG